MKIQWKNIKKRWWLWLIVAVVAVYIINGVVFAVFVYKKYPDQLPLKTMEVPKSLGIEESTSESDQSNEKEIIQVPDYPDQRKTVLFMTKIYPYPAAWVDGKAVWVKDYYKQLGFVEHFSEKTQQELPVYSELKKQVIDQMIDTELLRQQAKKYNIKVTNEEVDETFQKLVEENQGEQQVSEILEELYGMSEAEFKDLIRDQLLRQKIQEELFVKIKAKHILIKDEGKAKEILEEVKKGEKSFEDLAKEYSEDTGSRDAGGDLGWFGRGMMVQEFEDAVFDMESGKVKDDLVKSEFGYHIIKVEEKKGEIDKSYLDWFNEVKENSKISIWIKTEPESKKEEASVISPEENKNEEKNKDEGEKKDGEKKEE